MFYWKDKGKLKSSAKYVKILLIATSSGISVFIQY